MRIRERESELQAAVCVYLRHALPKEAFFFAAVNEGKRSPATGARLKKQGLLPGVADLVIVHEGMALFIELKTKRGRQSPEQIEFAKRCIECGSPYYLARTLAEVELVLAAEGLSARARIAA